MGNAHGPGQLLASCSQWRWGSSSGSLRLPKCSSSPFKIALSSCTSWTAQNLEAARKTLVSTVWSSSRRWFGSFVLGCLSLPRWVPHQRACFWLYIQLKQVPIFTSLRDEDPRSQGISEQSAASSRSASACWVCTYCYNRRCVSSCRSGGST